MLLILSAAVGLLYWWGSYELRAAPCEALTGQDVTVTARVTDWPLEREGYTRLSVTVTDGAPHVRAYLYLYHDELPALEPGDMISCTVRVRSAMLRGEERSHTATAAGRMMTGYIKGDVALLGRAPSAWLYFPQRIARYVGNTCRALFPGRAGVFMQALLTGDKEDLYADPELYGDMRAAGVLHAVAVSGMHVFILVEFIRRLFGRGKRTTLLCLPVMGLFVLMSGAGPSVVRAALMQTVYMGAPLADRESDSPTGLAAALLLILLINPMAVGGISLQLSFACMAGYAFFMPKLLRRISRLRRLWRHLPECLRGVPPRILTNLAATFSATALSIPVAAYYFGAVPLLAFAANLLALPVVEFLFAAGYVLCGVNALLPTLARLAAQVMTWGVRWCFLVFRAVARRPFSCLYTADPAAVVWLVLVYVMLAVWLVLRRKGRAWPAVIPAELAVMGLCLVFLWSGARLALGRREISVLDVGQGECVVLLDRDSSVVVDCGGSGMTDAGDTAADWLRAAGKKSVDLLILTHLDDDHVNGVETLLYRMPVGRILLPAAAAPEDIEELRVYAERYGTAVTELNSREAYALGELTVDLLLPEGKDDNDRGIVVMASWPGATALVMGDAGETAERSLLEQGCLRDVDVLVAGHHGSASAGSALFLRAADPETAVISVGVNSYGLPSEEGLDRLDRYCDEVLRTDEDGTVTISMKETDRYGEDDHKTGF